VVPQGENVISQETFRRVFHIRIGNVQGTAFTFEVEGRQYFATAKHLLGKLTDVEAVEFRLAGQWHLSPVKVVGLADGVVDVCVFATDQPALARRDWVADPTRYFVSQEVYFLGYPFGLGEPAEGDTLPNAFVKKGIVAAMQALPGGHRRLWVDGINNKGFSGGPIVVQTPHVLKDDSHVIGIISGYKNYRLEVEAEGQPPTGLFVRENTGLIEGFGIEHAVGLARANPIGLPFR
jgi:hypothetical protein